jgi:hypothetical protein
MIVRLKQMPGEAKRNKYGAVRTEVDGITFASGAEADRYATLLQLQRGGHISGLELQPCFLLLVGSINRPAERVKIGTYSADFRYIHVRTGAVIVEDVKGMDTQVSKLKRKLVQAIYGVTVLCVDGKGKRK